MFELKIILALLAIHWIADFIMQSDYFAKNKSSDNTILAMHCLTYIIPFALLGFVIPITAEWLLLNFVAHYITDYNTSRLTKKLWEAKEVHWFFVVIGFDQLLHYSVLFASYYWLVL